MKRMGLLNCYGMCKLVWWSYSLVFFGYLWKNKDFKITFPNLKAACKV